MNKFLREKWEQRAKDNKANLKGVLLQGLPDQVNSVINEWHYRIISKYILSRVREGGRILDLGCGYGRIKEKIKIDRPDIEIIGVDFSYSYCQLYSDVGGNAICGDVKNLAFKERSFDAIIGITVLMYVENTHRQLVVEEILSLLNHGGCFLSIEAGQEFMSLVGMLHPRSKKETTGGTGMTKEEYLELYPLTTETLTGGARLLSLLLPLWVFTARMFGKTPLKNIVIDYDSKASNKNQYCIHRWIVLNRMTGEKKTS